MEKEKLVALVTAAQSGDSDAVSELFSEFYNDLYYFALKTVKNDDTALDVTQDAFVDIINNLGTLKEPAAFVSWAKQITYHQCTRHFKKKTDVLVDEDEDGATIFDNLKEENAEFIPDEALDKDDFKKTILGILDTLPEDQRAAVMMYYFDEMSVREIADIQGVSEGTIKSRLNYARKSIKSSVEEYEKKNGIKLHAIPFFPLFKWLFEGSFSGGGISAAVAEGVSAATGVTVSATAAATTTTAATTVAATTTTAATVGIGAKIAAMPLVAKIVSGIVAAAIVVGTPTTAILLSNKEDGGKKDGSSKPTVSAPADNNDDSLLGGYGGPEEHLHSFTEETYTKEFGVITLNSNVKTCDCGETEVECPSVPILYFPDFSALEFLDRYFETAWGADGDYSIDGLFAAGDFIVSSPYYDQGSIKVTADEYYEKLQKYFTLSQETINKMKAARPDDFYTIDFVYNGTHLMEGTTVWLKDNIYRVFFVPSGSHADGMTRYYVDVEYNAHKGEDNKIIAIKPVYENIYDITRTKDNDVSGEQFAADVLYFSDTLRNVEEINYFKAEYGVRYLTATDTQVLYGLYQALDVFGYDLYAEETYGQDWCNIVPMFDGEDLVGMTINTQFPFSSHMTLEEEMIMLAQRDIEKFISLAGGEENIEVFDVETNWPNETETPSTLDNITTEKLTEISQDWFGDSGIRLKTKTSLTVGDKKYNLDYTFLAPDSFYYRAHNMRLTITFT